MLDVKFMRIKTVTITGADDNTNIHSMIEISKRFPFVEWGILFSQSKQNSSRYPSMMWVDLLVEMCMTNRIKRLHWPTLSAHLCGHYTHEYVTTGKPTSAINNLNWVMISDIFKRFQLNFNSSKSPACSEFYESLKNNIRTGMILQYNQANYDLCQKVISEIENRNIHFLYDGSGGRGVSPVEWSSPITNHFTGYAGGLNPDNLKEQLIKINEVVGDGEIWIDAETGLRTDDTLDIKKVVSFLEIASKYQ